MSPRAILAAFLLAWLAGPAPAVDPRNRTDSGQFTIYCDDGNVRRQVAGFAAKTKDEVLGLLGESGSWRHPIVVTINVLGVPLAAGTTPVTFSVVETEVGTRLEIVARLGTEPADVNLQKQFVRAVLLEYMLRQREAKTGTSSYVEPPWWLIEGATELIRRRETGVDANFFRTLIETNKLPLIESFLTDKPDELGPTALSVDRALSMSLVQLLVEQPDGRHRLAGFLRRWPASSGDPVEALGREFPGLAGGAPALQKWWTLNLARFGTTDRVDSLTAAETGRQIAALLEFDIPQKDGTPRHFAIGDFETYLKFPAGRQILAVQHSALVNLSGRAHVLLRPVIDKYEECVGLLARGKTRGVRDRLEAADRLRQAVARRADEIADYLNWFEATQSGSRTKAFDNYLRTANEMAEAEKKRRDPIARYLDEFERAY